jgi:multiple sugar transport system ATP-binding protein
MNFFPATVTPTGVALPFGEVMLPPEVQQVIASRPRPEGVIVGVRPEHIQDAALTDGYQRIKALVFEVTVDLVESLGADKYVYFTTAGCDVHSTQLDELDAESESHEKHFAARVPAESKAAIGQPIELALDPTKLAVFDADSGTNLTLPRAGATTSPASGS